MLIFFSHRFNLTGGARHIIHRIHHRFVVIRDREITLRFRDIKTGVQPAAVKDRQRQPGGDAHLLCGMAKQIAQVQGVLLQKRHQVDIGIKRRFCGVNAA